MKKESIFNTFICFFVVYLDIVIRIIYNSIGKDGAASSYHWTIILAIVAVLYLICISSESLIYHIVTLVVSLIPFILCIISLVLYDLNLEHIFSKLLLIHHTSEMLLFIPVYYFQTKKIIKFYKNEI